MENPRVLAIVPAYNESLNIDTVIAGLRDTQCISDILIINDCSTDATEQVVREQGENVISLPINLGIGGAVQTGLKFAREYAYDIAIQFDGDGQHISSEIPKLIEPVLSDQADVVIGSRFLASHSYRGSHMRRIGIAVFQFVNSMLAGSRFTDCTSGFRAYNKSAIRFLARYYPQDYPEPEAIIELVRNKFTVIEVPVIMQERQAGSSSITMIGSIYYMVKVLMASFIASTRKPVSEEH